MKKPLFSTIYVLTLMTAGLTIHQAFAERSPSVEPMTEVSIEENRPTSVQNGFDFADKNHATTPAVAAETKAEAKRVPANIATKSSEPSTPYSYIGPMIFLFALPVALWIVVSKKMKRTESAEKVDYYPKTFQFKPYQKQELDDEDQDFPKAS